MRENAPVSGDSRGTIEWAAAPARGAPGPVGREPPGQPADGQEPGDPEAGHGHGVPGQAPQRSDHGIGDGRGVPHEGSEQAAVGRPVDPEGVGRLVE